MPLPSAPWEPEHSEGQPDQPETRPQALQEEAPDHLVRAGREVAADVDDERRDEAPVKKREGDPRADGGVPVDGRGGRGAPRGRGRVGWELGRIDRRRRMGPRHRLVGSQPSSETITVARFVDPRRFLVSTAEVTGPVMDSDRGCRTQIRTRVSDAEKWLQSFSSGLHRVIFYGDHVQAIERMGRLMGFEVVREA